MAMTQTKIISLAVGLLGHKPVLSLEKPDDLVNAAVEAYDMLLPSVLSTGNWRFAATIQQLVKSVEVPPPGTIWKTIYLLPAGYLKNIRIWPNNYQYDIYENRKIYTLWDGRVDMEYIFQPDPSLFPPHFVNGFVYEIAAYLALSNAQKPEFAGYLDNKRALMMGMAAAIEAQNRPNFTQANFPVLDRRNVSTFIGVGNA